MAKFFNYFPASLYTLDDNPGAADIVTNLTFRFVFEDSLKDNSSAFYEHIIKDGDTPEMLAHKFYGSAERHWIILLFNDIIDPFYDWPLQQENLNNYIANKYGSVSWANSNVANYFKITTRTEKTYGTKQIDTLIVDANTYANVIVSTNTYTLGDNNVIDISVSKSTQSYYDYEVDLNDAKRHIKLLKKDFAPAAEQEYRRIAAL